MLDDDAFDPIYMAVVDAVEESVVNAMLAAEDMAGTRINRSKIEAIPIKPLLEIMKQHGRLGQ
jgi:L-aminopeptidase/D-esterase-like protein